MKVARFFAAVFAAVGLVLMLGTAAVCFASLDANAKVLETPDAAIACADRLVEAIDSGDLTSAAALMYGQPDLGAAGAPTDSVSAVLWEKYREEMACVASSKLYLSGSDFMRNVTVTVLDVSSITGSVQARAKTLLEQQVAAATDMTQLYDQENQFRKELIDRVMEQALEQAIREDAKYITCETAFKVICRGGKWWAVPEQALLNALAGAAA